MSQDVVNKQNEMTCVVYASSCSPEWLLSAQLYYFAARDVCLSRPCQNNGQCRKSGRGYKCRCNGLYGGLSCECGYYFLRFIAVELLIKM